MAERSISCPSKEAPSFGARVDTDYILGMAKMEGGVEILFDIDTILSAEKVTAIG